VWCDVDNSKKLPYWGCDEDEWVEILI